MPLEQATTGYETFREKRDGCIKVVLKPQDGAMREDSIDEDQDDES